MKRLLFFIAGLILFCNCNKEDSSKVVILVTTQDTLYNVEPGDDILFHVHSSAVDDLVKNITIMSSDAKSRSILLLDTLLNLKECNFDFHYIVPEYTDTMLIELSFNAFSSDNLSQSSYKTFLRSSSKEEEEIDTVLNSFNGLILEGCDQYTGLVRFFNLDSLTNMTLPFVDSSLMDIVDICGGDTIYLSREWESYTGVLFARFSDLDFDAASRKDIIDAYNMAIKHTSIQRLEEKDIILIGRKDTAIGVLRITSILDREMEYIFDLKTFK